MAWDESVVTNVGNALQAQALSGSIFKVVTAAGGDETVPAASLMAQTALKSQKQNFTIISVSDVEKGKKFKLQITNLGLAAGYQLKQIGLWATVDGGAAGLFAILQDKNGIPIPSNTEMPEFVLDFYAVVPISNTLNLTVTLDPTALVSARTLDEKLAGKASLGTDGKVSLEQLPAMDYIPTSEKGAASGVATLDASRKVPAAQLPVMNYDPAGSAAAVETNLGAAITEINAQLPNKANKKVPAAAGNLAALDAAGNLLDSGKEPADYVENTQKGTANGVATLGADAKVPAAQLPAMNYDPAGSAAAVQTSLNTHSNDTVKHVTAAERTAWNAKEPAVSGSTAATYWNGLKSFVDFAISVRAAVLTGLSVATSAVISATDTVLTALGKLQAQITGIQTAKADKKAPAVTGNLATLDAAGNLADSGKQISDFAAGTHNHAAADITDTVPVSKGGTGQSTLTSGAFLRGNVAGAVTMTAAADVPLAIGRGYGTCATAATTAAKVGTLANFVRSTGAVVGLKFTNANTHAQPTLNVNGTGASVIYDFSTGTYPVSGAMGNGTHFFMFNGTQWVLLNPLGGGGVRIQSGSYTGTGAVGEANPNTLTFGFEPKLVVIHHVDSSAQAARFIRGSLSSVTFMTSSVIGAAIVSWSGNGVSWYATANVNYQLNTAGSTYFYHAIG